METSKPEIFQIAPTLNIIVSPIDIENQNKRLIEKIKNNKISQQNKPITENNKIKIFMLNNINKPSNAQN